MISESSIRMLVGLLLALAPQGGTHPDLSGEWRLASATTNRTRDGATGDQPTRTYISEGSAFNCGRECRIVHRGSTLTIENAQFKTGVTVSSPTVVIPIDGRPHVVVDSVNLGNKIETVGSWKDGKCVITSMLLGIPTSQSISLEQRQLVVVKHYVASDTKLTLRYEKK